MRTVRKSLRTAAARARFVLSARRFTSRPLTVACAKAVAGHRLARRAETFISTVSTEVFENPRSPYHKLLAAAHVDLDWVVRWVGEHGVEGTLDELIRRDVVVTHEEWKAINAGRNRDHSRFPEGCTFDNPLRGPALGVRSSGSRSRGTRLLLDFEAVRELAIHRLLRLDAFGGLGRQHVVYLPGMPSFGGASMVLSGCVSGEPIAKWYSPLGSRHNPLVHRLQDAAFIGSLRLAGSTAPLPRSVALEDAAEVAAWIARETARGRPCTLLGYASGVVRVCQAAVQNSLDISGTLCFLVGEPTTEAKAAVVRSARCVPVASYSIAEVGHLANTCPESEAVDDMHLFSDAFALTTRSRLVPGFPRQVRPFVVTTLAVGSAKMLLNVEVDDYGELSERPCGCVWGRLGLTRRVRAVRSFVKLTAGGVTLSGPDVVSVIEEELPRRFGGSPTDYQLVEEEDGDGTTRLMILASPALGTLDTAEVARFFRQRLAEEGALARFFGDLLEAGGSLQVRRRRPVATAGGKVLPFHTLSAPSDGMGYDRAAGSERGRPRTKER